MMRNKIYALAYLSLLVGFGTGLAGCGGNAPTTTEGGILTGFDSLPKQLVTLTPSVTTNAPDQLATQVQATLSQSLPTITGVPATNTPTTTPYVGVFMGESTHEPGNALIRVAVSTRLALTPVDFTPGPSNVTRTRAPRATLIPLIVTPATTLGASGVIAPLTTPISAIAPVATVAGSGSTSGVICGIAPAAPFAKAAANPFIQQQIGCPVAEAVTVNAVTQPFERGVMFWRNTQEVYVLSTAQIQASGATVDQFWRVADQWNDSLPANDPALAPPNGLQQPIRGFGYVWRSNQPIRDALGWATQGEAAYGATWQDFERGWMLTGNNGLVYAIAPAAAIHFGPLPP